MASGSMQRRSTREKPLWGDVAEAAEAAEAVVDVDQLRNQMEQLQTELISVM